MERFIFNENHWLWKVYFWCFVVILSTLIVTGVVAG